MLLFGFFAFSMDDKIIVENKINNTLIIIKYVNTATF